MQPANHNGITLRHTQEEATLYQDNVYSVKQIDTIQDSAELKNIQQNTKHNSVRSTTHVICVSKLVNTRQILVPRS